MALWADGRILARRFEAMSRGQAEALMPMVAALIEETGVRFAELDRLAVTVGPGSFTGLRIGLAAARGMALATRLPLVGVTTLEAVAHAVPAAEREGRRLLVVLEAGRPDLYLQLFDPALAPLGPVEAAMPEAVAPRLPGGPLVVAGNAAAAVCRLLAAAGLDARPSSAPGLPDAARVAEIAAGRPPDEAGPPAPLYLHPHYARPPETARR